MKIVTESINLSELKKMAEDLFGDMVKGVVDVDKDIVALDGELHSDLEAALIGNGSKQKSLWGINIYPEMHGDEFIEFDSMINVRPSQNNKSRGVDDADLRRRIVDIISRRVKR